MLNLIANFVDHPVARVTLSLAGLAVTILFGLFSAVLALSPETGWLRVVGIGGLVGLAGWWGRVFLTLATLRKRPLLRWLVLVALAIGVVTTLYAMLAFPGADSWYIIMCAISFIGVLLFAGTLAPSQTGPNNSFKPNPLRGSA